MQKFLQQVILLSFLVINSANAQSGGGALTVGILTVNVNGHEIVDFRGFDLDPWTLCEKIKDAMKARQDAIEEAALAIANGYPEPEVPLPVLEYTPSEADVSLTGIPVGSGQLTIIDAAGQVVCQFTF